MIGLGLGVGKGSVYGSSGVSYTTFRTWANDVNLTGSDGFQAQVWDGTPPTLSFETGTLDGESNYAKLLANQTQTNACRWRDNNVKDDSGATINFASYTNYRVEAKMYASLDSSRTQITFSTSFGSSSQDQFETTLQDETWTNIDVSGTFSGSSSHFYLWDWDKSGNYPIAGEFFAMKDVKLSLG